MKSATTFHSIQELHENGIGLRNLKPSDALEVMKLYKTYRKTTFTKEHLENIFKDFPCMAFTLNRNIIAFCYTEFFAPDIIEISSIFVAKEWRSKGLGALLLEQLHLLSLSAGFNGAILSNSMLYETKEEKISPRNFYQRMGYSCVLSTDKTDIYTRSLKNII